jgi:hypothetical protein
MKKKSYVRCLYLCLPELLSSPLFLTFWKGINEKDEEENIINLTSDRREQVHFFFSLAFLFSTKCPVSLLNFSFKKTRTNEKSFDDFSFYGQSNKKKNNVNRTKLK